MLSKCRNAIEMQICHRKCYWNAEMHLSRKEKKKKGTRERDLDQAIGCCFDQISSLLKDDSQNTCSWERVEIADRSTENDVECQGSTGLLFRTWTSWGWPSCGGKDFSECFDAAQNRRVFDAAQNRRGLAEGWQVRRLKQPRSEEVSWAILCQENKLINHTRSTLVFFRLRFSKGYVKGDVLVH